MDVDTDVHLNECVSVLALAWRLYSVYIFTIYMYRTTTCISFGELLLFQLLCSKTGQAGDLVGLLSARGFRKLIGGAEA